MAGSPHPDRPGSLPRPPTPLVGREGEAASVAALLADEAVSLLTLTGPGGVGKTRLALAAAAAAAQDFADGVAFVPLAAVADPGLVEAAIAQALGVREAGEQPLADRLRASLRDRDLLLVLDNVEQVVEAAPLVADLLAACPALTVLATSRVRLRLSGERESPVPPLPVPPAADPDEDRGAGAVRLFAERARAVQPDFALTADTAPVVSEICRRLDGLPLAIELAAARVKVLPPDALLRRLERRLPLLTGGGRDLPARQQTMRDAIAWSHDLLTPEEQTLFHRLAVFVGGFGLDAAEVVAGTPDDPGSDVFEGIAALVDESLMLRAPGPAGEPRYAMLETIREYGLEQLAASGEADAIRGRHAAWCLDLAEQGHAALFSGRSIEPRWLDRLEAEHGNGRAALAWFAESAGAESALGLAGALGWYWYLRGHLAEARRWLEQTLAHPQRGAAAQRARALVWLGVVLHEQGEPARAIARLEEGLAIRTALGDLRGRAEALFLLGWITRETGAYGRATTLLTESLALIRELEAGDWVAHTLYQLGVAAHGQGETARARAALVEALALARDGGHPYGIAQALHGLGSLACDEGDVAGAARAYRESLTRWQEVRIPVEIVAWLARVATLAAAAGRAGDAARLFGAAMALRRTQGAAFGLPERARFDRAMDQTRRMLGEERFRAEQAAGRALPLDLAIAEASAMLTALVAAAPMPAADEQAGDAGLTRREREVLRLIVDGATDREIAAALSISPRTVGAHVAHILAKLGVETRRGARREALQRGLV